MRSLLSLAWLLSLASTATSLRAQPGRGGGRDLEQRVRQRMAAEVKARLELTDDQLSKLTATNRKFDEQRRQLFSQEREIRQGLREEVRKANAADQARVSQLIDRALDVQRRRIELTSQEQRDLATYLTPVQRAKYLGLQEAVRRRMEEMRRRRAGRGGDAGGGRGRAPPD
jgi:Spy/CpxP family protein refolding chaperone